MGVRHGDCLLIQRLYPLILLEFNFFQVCRALNEVYRRFNRDQYPAVILNVQIASGGFQPYLLPSLEELEIPAKIHLSYRRYRR